MSTTDPTTPEWISIQDAAIRLAVSVDTLRGWIAAGELPASRIGTRRTRDGRALGRVRIRMADLDELIHPIPAARKA